MAFLLQEDEYQRSYAAAATISTLLVEGSCQMELVLFMRTRCLLSF